VARSSSAHKLSRLAQKGKGKKVRFQGGTVFPSVVLGVCIVGTILVAYARQSAAPIDTAAAADESYYTSLGVYVCDGFVSGLPATGTSEDGAVTVVEDGVLSWKPVVLAGERRSRLGTLLEQLGVDVTDDTLTLPAGATVNGQPVNEGKPVTEAETTCGDEPASLSVTVWRDLGADGTEGSVSIASLDGVRLDDNLAIVLAFVPDDVETAGLKPPSVDRIELLRQG